MLYVLTGKSIHLPKQQRKETLNERTFECYQVMHVELTFPFSVKQKAQMFFALPDHIICQILIFLCVCD